MTREDGPFVARLARAAGARESRYAHLFSGMPESDRTFRDRRGGARLGGAWSAASVLERVDQLEASRRRAATGGGGAEERLTLGCSRPGRLRR